MSGSNTTNSVTKREKFTGFKGDLQDILRFIVFQIAEYAFKSARTSLKVEKDQNFQLFSTFLLRQYCIDRV